MATAKPQQILGLNILSNSKHLLSSHQNLPAESTRAIHLYLSINVKVLIPVRREQGLALSMGWTSTSRSVQKTN